MEVDKIDLNNLDKSDWKTYRFDEIAQSISERIDPNNTDLEVYIGLEHIDSESLHIKRFGTPDDVTGTKLKFYKGDIIFGRRRAYQRKAGIATCDGFCSAHALVLRANPDVIDPELFPFFLHSDLFMDRAIDISVGSLSPTINWGTLKHQEFRLPPSELHLDLANLLWRATDQIESDQMLKSSVEQIYEVQREYLLKNVENGDPVRLGDISKLQGGGTFKSKDATTEGTKWLKIANVGFNEIKWEDKSFLPDDFKDTYTNLILNDGDIVIALTRPILGDVLKVARITAMDEGALLNQRVGRVIISGDIEPSFLYEHLRSRSFLVAMKKALQGTDPPNISNKMYENYVIDLPSKKAQKKILSKLELLNDSLPVAEKKIETIKNVKFCILNEVF
jgi:restriction endonuclease S subunit